MAGDATYSTNHIISPSATRTVFKSALDLAIEKANARETPSKKQGTYATRPERPALDLSEIMDSNNESGKLRCIFRIMNREKRAAFYEATKQEKLISRSAKIVA